MADELDTSAVLNAVRNAGCPLTAAQLRRLQGADLISRPRQVGSGRGQGSKVYYHSSDLPQIIQASKLLKMRRDYKWIGWKLFWTGFSINSNIWIDILKECAATLDFVSSNIRKASEIESDTGEDDLSHLILAAFEQKNADVRFKRMRKRLGRERFPTAMGFLMQIALGEFTSISSTGTSLQDRDLLRDTKIIDLALGVTRSRTDRVNGGPPLIEGDYSLELQKLSSAISVLPMTLLLSSTPQSEILSLRDEYALLTRGLSKLGRMAELSGGKGALGLQIFSDFNSLSSSTSEDAYSLLIWMGFRSQGNIRDNVLVLLEALKALPEGFESLQPFEEAYLKTAAKGIIKSDRVVFPNDAWIHKEFD